MKLDDVKPTEIIFKKEIFASTHSFIFPVDIRQQTCVMKVHHERGPRRYYEPKGRELDIHMAQTAVWLDFDRAHTYDKDRITAAEEDLIKEEEAIVMKFKDAIAADVVKGELDETY
ncbi:hypothetical protein N7455_003856 [Penicillium solitum]|uniref:uncharacterized protein n=1 Tax=Penicillium solitum TaxID=60172 RepID=UPI0032C49941|nr:hypothetical protein N7455_003856 [Penicillium solitum]